MRSYVIPFGFNITTIGSVRPCFFIQMVDHLMPSRNGQYKLIGGLVEEGETPKQAILRELSEEVPGWLDKVRNPMPIHENYCFGYEGVDSNGLFEIYKDSEIIIFGVYVDAGSISWKLYKESTTEGSPVCFDYVKIIYGTVPSQWVFENCYTECAKLARHLNTQIFRE